LDEKLIIEYGKNVTKGVKQNFLKKIETSDLIICRSSNMLDQIILQIRIISKYFKKWDEIKFT